ncbi:hypothetical protein HYV81_01275 [Candidatus Woesearchaeota archaeon]|nr:hypothetical protein [Candidatus Woesearchaeota archaeon]
MAYLKQTWQDFIASFKELDKRFIAILLLDIALYAALALGVMAFWEIIKKRLNYIPPMPIFNPEITPVSELDAFYGIVTGIRLEIAVYLLVFLIIAFFIWTFVKGLQWSISLRKKYDVQQYMRHVLVNGLWQLCWLVTAIILLFVLMQNALKFLGLILLAVYLHMGYIKYAQTVKTEKVFASLKETLRVGLGRLHLFVLPYLAMSLVLLLLSQLYYAYQYLPDAGEIAVFLLLVIVWMAWTRLYVAKVLKPA